MDIDVKSLHPLEIRLLRHVHNSEEITANRLVNELKFKLGQCNQAFSWLESKGLIAEYKRETKVYYELTDLGRLQAKIGLPGERIFNLLKEKASQTLPEIAKILKLEQRDVGSAFGQLSKAGVFGMDEEKKAVLKDTKLPESFSIIKGLIERASVEMLADSDLVDEERRIISRISKKRGASQVPFKIIEREEVIYTITASGLDVQRRLVSAGVTGDELGAVTSSMLATESWKDRQFRSYSLSTPPSRVLLGRRNPYGEYLQWVKDKLTSLGFEEFDGPLVETEFWNVDALFMPQFHSARDIHDVYYLKNASHAKKIEQPYLDRVAAVHENGWTTGSRGWEYSFDHEFTRRQVMRSQGTVLSAKTLPHARIPGKYFGVVRCFRYDQVDATHGADFYQTEGIVLGNDVNLRTLLGLLKMFAEELAGAEEVKYVPGYFPFTEPSIEVHIKHPILGWFELGGSGILRPEVTKAMGIDVPVLAWGLGIDRMALMHLGLSDLRELFTPDIESVRMRRGD